MNKKTINRLGFGTLNLADRDTAIPLLRKAIELGVNFIDTADVYGCSEEFIAEALYPYPDNLVIATKGGMLRPTPRQWIEHGTPEHLRAACVASLKRLKLECIDLYQLHRIDPKVPLADQAGVLQDLQREGKIKQIGLSEVNLEQLKTFNAIVNVVSVQNKYNLVQRRSEDVLDYCTKNNILFMPWAPLAMGELSAKVSEISQQLNATPQQIILAWLLQKSICMLPIPGTSKISHLEENLQAALLTLDKNTMEKLNEIMPASAIAV